MTVEVWLAFALASAFILAIPGPTVLLVIACTIERGARVALWCLFGIVPGVVLGIAASFVGLGAILAASASLFTLVKWVGAAYLIWLGIRQWRRASAPASSPSEEPAGSRRRLVAQAFVITALNPKAVIFYAAFMPQFMNPSAPATAQMVVMGATFVALLFPVLGAYVVAATMVRRGLRGEGWLRWLNRVAASMMIAAGAMTAAMRGVQAAPESAAESLGGLGARVGT